MFDDVPLEHEYHNLGNDCYRLGQYEKAIAHYTKALELNPRMVETYFNRALAYARTGDYDAALADATCVVEESTELFDAYYLRGRIWELRLDDRAAIADYERAIRLNPSFTTAAEQLRLITSREETYRELRHLRDQIALEPANGYLRYQFGQRLSTIGHNDDALRALESARANGFVLADLWVELGQVYGALGRAVQAITAFRQAIRVNPTEVAAYAHLGQLLSEAGRYREAITAFRQALAMPNDDAASLYCGLGTALNGLKRRTEARQAFQQALALEPRSAEAALGLALVAWRQGQHETAWDWCGEALGRSPSMVPALILAVSLTVSKGDLAGASEMILRAFQARPDDERLAYVLWAVAAYLSHRDGAAARNLWETHAGDVRNARRLVLDRVKTRGELRFIQRDLPRELLAACPLADEAAETLYQRLVTAPRNVLAALYEDMALPGAVSPVERLRRVANLARRHDEAWLAEVCAAYAAVLSGTPEAPRIDVLLRVVGRLGALGARHAELLLGVYRLCLDGLSADSVESIVDLEPRVARLALMTDESNALSRRMRPVLFSLSEWLDEINAVAHGADSSREWTDIVEQGIELRVQITECLLPPERWALANMVTNFGTIIRQHVPTV